jgi:hypothetical protein
MTNRITNSSICANRHRAKKIKRWTGRALTVAFMPEAMTGDDQESQNHLWCGTLTHDRELLWADDRKPESVSDQIARGLRRLAADCEWLAQKIEQCAANSQTEGGAA